MNDIIQIIKNSDTEHKSTRAQEVFLFADSTHIINSTPRAQNLGKTTTNIQQGGH